MQDGFSDRIYFQSATGQPAEIIDVSDARVLHALRKGRMKLLGDDVLPRQGLNPRCRESFDERREVGPCRGLRLPSAESHIDLRARLRPSAVGRQNDEIGRASCRERGGREGGLSGEEEY